MKRLGIILFINLFVLSLPVNAVPANIPAATLQIAREAEMRQITKTPSSDVVRVGISSNGFTTWVYKNI